jgi:hypothetical protein
MWSSIAILSPSFRVKTNILVTSVGFLNLPVPVRNLHILPAKCKGK